MQRSQIPWLIGIPFSGSSFIGLLHHAQIVFMPAPSSGDGPCGTLYSARGPFTVHARDFCHIDRDEHRHVPDFQFPSNVRIALLAERNDIPVRVGRIDLLDKPPDGPAVPAAADKALKCRLPAEFLPMCQPGTVVVCKLRCAIQVSDSHFLLLVDFPAP
jgi:hypothetical protein